eukprot:scaffold208851_cov33-Tisochrysis_lutea.AAC.2
MASSMWELVHGLTSVPAPAGSYVQLRDSFSIGRRARSSADDNLALLLVDSYRVSRLGVRQVADSPLEAMRPVVAD